MGLSLGIDFGTSGARAIAIDFQGNIQAQTRCADPETGGVDGGEAWRMVLETLLMALPREVRGQVQRVAIDGTSSTVVLCDRAGRLLDAPIFYHDGRGKTVLDQLQSIAPENHTVLSATSSLAKLLWWTQQPSFESAAYFLHQADWLGFLLHGQLGVTDYHNALKLGYDVENLTYPDWLTSLAIAPLLPQVWVPGQAIAPLQPSVAEKFGFPTDCQVCAGTTDSIAAFLASGTTTPGTAVTSLGSTLVLKLLSHTPVTAAQYGIYSHRLGDLWLVGGASNTGGAVLKQFFSDQELQSLSQAIDPTQSSDLDYYPLTQPGDRFPLNDPHLPPRLTPRPNDPVAFLHGLLESMARIEAQGYRLLQDLGVTPLVEVYTAGGGAGNLTWQTIRARLLGVPVQASRHTEAAYGTALLAQGGSQPLRTEPERFWAP